MSDRRDDVYVKVLYDLENLWLEPDFPFEELKERIQQGLHKFNPKYQILGKIIACGVRKRSTEDGIAKLISTGEYQFTFFPMRKVNCPCGRNIRPAANTRPENMYERKTDLADVRLVKWMFLHAIDHLPSKCVVLLISSDGDFVKSILELQGNEVEVIIAIDRERSSYHLCNSGTAAWYWQDLVKGGKPLTQAERKKHKSQSIFL